MVPAEALGGAPAPARAVTLRLEGVLVVALIGADGRARLERLLTTDPAHYLRPDLRPGVDLTAQAEAAGVLAGAATPVLSDGSGA